MVNLTNLYIMNKKGIIKKLILCTLFIVTISSGFTAIAKADEVGIAVSPSKVYDEQMDIGETKQFTFSVKNSSITSGVTSSLNIELKASIFNEFGEELDNNGIVSLEKSSMNLPTGKVDTVVATVIIPSNFTDGSYVIYADFVFKSVNVNSPILQTNIIKVPLYMYVGDRNTFKDMKLDFEILENHLDYEKTSILKETLSSFITCLNPIKVKDVYRGIINKPAYLFTRDGKEFLDTNYDITTKLSNVVTHRERGLSDWKYVYCKKEDETQIVSSVSNSGNNLALLLENGNSVIIDCSTGNLKDLDTQIASIRSTNAKSTLKDLLENVTVPINKTYYKKLPVLVSTIKSLSPIPITINGEFSNTRNYSNLLYTAKVFSPTILPDEVGEFKNNITDKDLAKGDYQVVGKFNVRTKYHDLSHSFEIGNQRNKILTYLTILLLSSYTVVSIAIKLIVKKFKRSKKENKLLEESMPCDDSLNIKE